MSEPVYLLASECPEFGEGWTGPSVKWLSPMCAHKSLVDHGNTRQDAVSGAEVRFNLTIPECQDRAARVVYFLKEDEWPEQPPLFHPIREWERYGTADSDDDQRIVGWRMNLDEFGWCEPDVAMRGDTAFEGISTAKIIPEALALIIRALKGEK